MKRSIAVTLCIVVLVFSVFVAGCTPKESEDAGEEKYTFKVIQAFMSDTFPNFAYDMFVERVTEKYGDKITFELEGGPEAIPAFDQVEALGAGVIDIAVVPPPYGETVLPGGEAIELISMTPQEARDSGLYAMLQEAWNEQGNVYFLGVCENPEVFTIYTQFEVNSLNDFKGKNMRCSPAQLTMLEALGVSAHVIPAGDVYTSLERGIVNGFVWPRRGITDYSWHEHTKYAIKPGFWQGPTSILFNSDVWFALPEDLRDDLEKIYAEVERDIVKELDKGYEEELAFLEDYGIEVITLSEKDAEEFTAIANKALRDSIIEKDPKWGPIFVEAFDKGFYKGSK